MSILEEYKTNAEKRELYRRQLDGLRRQKTQEVAFEEERRQKELALEREQQALERERQASERERQASERERQASERERHLIELLRRFGVNPDQR